MNEKLDTAACFIHNVTILLNVPPNFRLTERLGQEVIYSVEQRSSWLRKCDCLEAAVLSAAPWKPAKLLPVSGLWDKIQPEIADQLSAMYTTTKHDSTHEQHRSWASINTVLECVKTPWQGWDFSIFLYVLCNKKQEGKKQKNRQKPQVSIKVSILQISPVPLIMMWCAARCCGPVDLMLLKSWVLHCAEEQSAVKSSRGPGAHCVDTINVSECVLLPLEEEQRLIKAREDWW